MSSKKKNPVFRPLQFPALFLLGIMCLIFYAALDYYAGGALNTIHSPSGFERIMVLRAGFSVLFSVLLGVVGAKITGKIWPATMVHLVAVSFMLCMDMGIEQMLADWDISLILLGGMGTITALASAGSLFSRWVDGKVRK